MCGFLFTYSSRPIDESQIQEACSFIRTRGPDKTSSLKWVSDDAKYGSATHFLLDVSGVSSQQPLQIFDSFGTPEFTLLFNGEVYNYKDLSCDASCDTEAIGILLAAGRKLPFSRLDGEYAIVIWNHNNNCITVATDQFMTKPVSVGWNSDFSFFGVASYPSALSSLGADQIAYATPNTAQVFNLCQPESWTLPGEQPTSQLSTVVYSVVQSSSTYDDWVQGFLSAVRKRALHGTLPIFVPLSSGYDSGAICLALNLLRIPYNTITIDSGEHSEIINARVKLNSRPTGSCDLHMMLPALTDIETADIREKIAKNCEHFRFLHSDQVLLDDDGAIGAYRISEVARDLGWLVCLSGCGADEIISDYGFNGKKYYPHSEFGGLFPNELQGFFPWKKFYADSMRSYLFKDELIYGAFGIEGRFPFLDPTLTQAFLSLTSTLKNLEYKAPIASFLRKYDYPFEEGIKRGFTPYLAPSPLKSSSLHILAKARLGIGKAKSALHAFLRSRD